MPSARTRKELQALHAELAETAAAPDATPKPARRTRSAKAAAGTEPSAHSEAASPPPETPEAGASAPSTLSELQALVRELQDAVHDATETAEDAVTAHPTAALASAFLLGVLVGRAWR
ncbi:hypothetical protein [Azorhizobium sp. AG788]|uniref:hypothetical protein n=1 Tax=Azorhizobium sp. AG788 TaxID=2183897 RepID=UPI003138EB77